MEAEDQAETQKRLNSAQLAMNMDQFSIQLGNNPTLDVPALIRKTMEEGGWTDVSEVTFEQEAGQLPAGEANAIE